MSDREEMVALAGCIDAVVRYGCNYPLRPPDAKTVVAALRSVARTGPDVADNGILNAAKFVASRDREMLAQMLFALHERPDSPSPIRFNCSWKQLKSFNRASFYKCADDIRAIAALPAQATASGGEEVTAHTLARIIEPSASGYTREFQAAERVAEKLLATYKMTKRSAT